MNIRARAFLPLFAIIFVIGSCKQRGANIASGLNDSETSGRGEVKTKISTLSSVSYDGKKLEVSYVIGGGCAEHKPKVSVSMDKSRPLNAVIHVFDVASELDTCESLLSRSASVDLRSLIVEEAKKAGLNQPEYANFFVKLPNVILSTGVSGGGVISSPGGQSNSTGKKLIGTVSALNFKGNEVSFKYVVSGGCAEHKADVAVKLDLKDKSNPLVVMEVSDVPSEADLCQSLISVNGKANLGSIINESVKNVDIHPDALANAYGGITVVLPNVLSSPL